VFAFDPSFATRLDTAVINELVLEIPWEVNPKDGADWPAPGPVGEYLEVVDHDPASRACYEPVDLNHPYLVARDGLAPSEGNPQFHQQMVYAVAMTTIGHFERALGRVALWAPHQPLDRDGKPDGEPEPVRKLRIYPHALRELNAWYSPRKKALLFGYAPARPSDPLHGPDNLVFTCLSHDIIAHETTHALLDGLHPYFAEPSNPDVLALHEAFADIVALFQRFTIPQVLHHQIARTRGDLQSQNLLAQLAWELGQATGGRGALRDALGRTDPDTQEWLPKRPKPADLLDITAPHERGSILVAAVFDAFLMIYRSRVADLLRIATQGTGVLPAGDIHPDLVERLAEQASTSARHVLRMCIRALDYCPPADVTFGDYLRALITADLELHPEDQHLYRVALIDAFRQRGIFPQGVRGMTEDTLAWPSSADLRADLGLPAEGVQQAEPPDEGWKDWKVQQSAGKEQRAILPYLQLKSELLDAPQGAGDPEPASPKLQLDWNLETPRERVAQLTAENAATYKAWLLHEAPEDYWQILGLNRSPQAPPTVQRGDDGLPAAEVHSVRSAVRSGPRGALKTEIIVEITQTRWGFLDPHKQRTADEPGQPTATEGDFAFRRGCTVHIEPASGTYRRVIRTRGSIADPEPLERMRRWLTREDPAPDDAFHARQDWMDPERFALLHRLY